MYKRLCKTKTAKGKRVIEIKSGKMYLEDLELFIIPEVKGLILCELRDIVEWGKGRLMRKQKELIQLKQEVEELLIAREAHMDLE